MSAGDITQGRRVASIEELDLPGDYVLRPEGDGGRPSLWFRLPRVEECPPELAERPYFKDCWDMFWTSQHRIDSKWAITDHGDTVTASPSILTWTELGLDRIRTEWHGYLERGVWREV